MENDSNGFCIKMVMIMTFFTMLSVQSDIGGSNRYKILSYTPPEVTPTLPFWLPPTEKINNLSGWPISPVS